MDREERGYYEGIVVEGPLRGEHVQASTDEIDLPVIEPERHHIPTARTMFHAPKIARYIYHPVRLAGQQVGFFVKEDRSEEVASRFTAIYRFILATFTMLRPDQIEFMHQTNHEAHDDKKNSNN